MTHSMSFKKAVLKVFLLICALQCSLNCNAQTEEEEYNDVELSEIKFLNLVKKEHPIVKQANLLIDRGDAKLRTARGNFDPQFYGQLDQKYFDDKTYYSLLQSGLKVPTWFGITLDAGIEDNRGTQLNPEDLTPAPDLWHAGISVPLAQGLFLDKRRAELKKAKIFQELTKAERTLLINEVLLEASTAYWDWYSAYYKLSVVTQALENAQLRLDGVIQSAIRGDKPYIDTLEATIQVQTRLSNQLEADLELRNKRQFLETFLWANGIVPLELKEGTRPPELNASDVTLVSPEVLTRMDSLTVLHPKLNAYRSELAMALVDVRLKRQYLLPKVDLKYNALTFAADRSDLLTNYSMNNYNWGLKVNLPLFLRRERGELKMANIKQKELDFKFKNEIAQVNYKAQVALNKLDVSRQQVNLYEETVENYQLLYDSEVFLFGLGESSLFLVNSREKSWLDAQIKLVSLQAKNRISNAELNYHLATF
ncbi:MAG: TolC family protein [Flavobacteriales bacterium]